MNKRVCRRIVVGVLTALCLAAWTTRKATRDADIVKAARAMSSAMCCNGGLVIVGRSCSSLESSASYQRAQANDSVRTIDQTFIKTSSSILLHANAVRVNRSRKSIELVITLSLTLE